MIDKNQIQNMIKAKGIEDRHNAAIAQLLVEVMATMMTPVEAPAANSHTAVSQQPVAAESTTTTTAPHQNDLTLDRGQVELVMEEAAEQLTDDDTDTEGETTISNGNAKNAKKNIPKSEKKKKAAAAKQKAATESWNAD